MFKLKRSTAVLALCSIVFFSACGAQSAIDVASQIVTSASVNLPVDSEVKEYLAQVGTDLKFVSSLISQIANADPVSKQSIQQQIQQKFAAISAKLPQILNLVQIKNPKLSTEISVAVAIVNSALVIIAEHMPPGSVQSPQSASRTIGEPTIGRTAKDFKNAWNQAVKDSHPQAKI